MTLEWDVPMVVDFPEEKLEKIVDSVQKDGWDYNRIVKSINSAVACFDDGEYYAWGEEQTKEVINEIKRRVGGFQLSMFSDPFGVPDDYNEGWQ